MKNNPFYIILIILIFQSSFVQAQDYYWIDFTDKNNSPYSLNNPDEFLSERAIQRRIAQNIIIDSLDLPVNSSYIEQIIQPGVSFVHASKWLNGITVKVEIDSFENIISKYEFVKEVQLTKPCLINKSAINKFDEPNAWSDNLPIDTTYYGPSSYQTWLINGQFLHKQNFLGQEMQIAVLDAGFFNADIYPAFDSLWANNQILGTKDFVDSESDFFQTYFHGMSVLSCMGGNVPNELIGTAPKASYWLIRSEDASSEYIIEEDNWVVAAEFADSVGADIINSSLGYFLFDDSTTNHSYADMDGKTTRVTQAANIAASRGMLVFSSAGNEGNDPWKYIIAPSDGDSVIGVGAVNKYGFPADFTSYGPASDGDIKPNVSAVGWNTFLQRSNGTLNYGSGTSYASPVMAGMAACLWQANPHATAAQVKEALEISSHLYLQPDSVLGFGVPDMKIAHELLDISSSDDLNAQKNWLVYPNPIQETIVIQKKGTPVSGNVIISVYTLDGRLILLEQKSNVSKIILNNLESLPTGLLILKIDSKNSSESIKLSKNR